jgi:ABC-type transport system substrate-binding protein
MAEIRKALFMLTLVALMSVALIPIDIASAQDETLFDLTIIAPGNANMVRRQWGQIIANSWRQLGINARVVYVGWAAVYDRVFTPPLENIGQTWDNGGFDIQLVGWTPGLVPQPRQLYYGGPQHLAPYGQNYPLFNNSEVNDLLDLFITTTNVTEWEKAVKDYQAIFVEELPSSQIFYTQTPGVVKPALYTASDFTTDGGWWLYLNAQPMPQYLKGQSSVVYCSTGEIESLVPPLSNSWYDTIIHSNIHNGLVEVAPEMGDLSIPSLLTDWVSSDGGYNWTFTCREGVTWHDGEDFTADDVVFTWWALMNPATGSQFVGTYQSPFGNNCTFTFSNGTSTNLTASSGPWRTGSITALNATTIVATLPELAGGLPYGYFDPYLLGIGNNMLPEHVYGQLDVALWTDSPMNTGQGSIDIGGTTYTGPVGTGPYEWVSFDPVAQLVHLQKYTNYWNASALEAEGYFGVTDYYIKFIADKTPALAALKNGEVDILDSQYQMQVDVASGSIGADWGTVLLLKGTGRQEVGYNHRHPVIGTGVDTPLGQSDPTKAADAARYVRQALDYAIPRQLIIDNLLAGFGDPGASNIPTTSPIANASVVPRPYNLTAARELLAMAGYTVPLPPAPPAIPGFLLGMSTVLSGTYTDPDTGGIIANRELSLWVTTNNASWANTTEYLQTITTDLQGFYTFTVTPDAVGTHYYYLFDRLATPVETEAQWKYLGSVTVTSFTDALDVAMDPLETDIDTLQTSVEALQSSVSTLTMVAGAAILIAIVFGVIAIYMARQ